MLNLLERKKIYQKAIRLYKKPKSFPRSNEENLRYCGFCYFILCNKESLGWGDLPELYDQKPLKPYKDRAIFRM